MLRRPTESYRDAPRRGSASGIAVGAECRLQMGPRRRIVRGEIRPAGRQFQQHSVVSELESGVRHVGES